MGARRAGQIGDHLVVGARRTPFSRWTGELSYRREGQISIEAPDSVCGRIAAAQYGVISRAQARRAGLSADSIARRLRAGRWARRHPGVYVMLGAPRSWEQELVAALLKAGPKAVSARRTAAALHRLSAFRPGPIEILTPRQVRFSHRGAMTLRRESLESKDVAVIRGIPATRIERTLIDLAAVTTPELLEVALDEALRLGMTSTGKLRRRLDQLGTRGRHGAKVVTALLEGRANGPVVHESALEVGIARSIRRAGLPPPVCQYNVYESGRFLGRVDLAYPEVKLGIEVDG